jgi:hypothetical protein
MRIYPLFKPKSSPKFVTAFDNCNSLNGVGRT